MALSVTEDTKLGLQAHAYVIELYRELTAENVAPTLGSQNQAVAVIRADPELPPAAVAWAGAGEREAVMAPRRFLPFDARYDRLHAFLEQTMTLPVFR